MPEVVTTNTMAGAYMIGEKAADMIKQDWGYDIDPIQWKNRDISNYIWNLCDDMLEIIKYLK